MFTDDPETIASLNHLVSIVRRQSSSLVFWIGAGASAWAGYGRWQEVAAEMHSIFAREHSGYNARQAADFLDRSEFPSAFEEMRKANEAAYFSILVGKFGARAATPVYERLLRGLKGLSPLRIITTNVDELLERSLTELEVLQRSDIERIPRLMAAGKGFVCKLHGSISSVSTLVFSTRDYDQVSCNDVHAEVLRALFSDSTVIFLGYGVGDEYIVDCLTRSAAGRPLFGSGPHFIVTATNSQVLPDGVRRIRYVAERPDHRAALSTIDVMIDARSSCSLQAPSRENSLVRESLYFIGDLIPFGKWPTSQVMSIDSIHGGRSHQLIVGQGYIDGEIKVDSYSALHDVLVGLMCFDLICVGIEHVGLLHHVLGSEAFWLVVGEGAIRVVDTPKESGVVFPDQQALIGDLILLTRGSRADTADDFAEMHSREKIRNQLKATPGNHERAERLLTSLDQSVIDAGAVSASERLQHAIRSVLVHPTIRHLVGISGGAPAHAVPRWLAFPVLRLADVVRRGLICDHIKAAATRMLWGNEKLASVAFSAGASQTAWVEDAARYVLAGRSNADIGALAQAQPNLIAAVMRFRGTPQGVAFRREILGALSVDEGGELATVINAGLRQALPFESLESARSEFECIFTYRGATPKMTPAIWGDPRNGDARIERWRRRSRIELERVCEQRSITLYSKCPCGSGEKLKFCCLEALS